MTVTLPNIENSPCHSLLVFMRTYSFAQIIVWINDMRRAGMRKKLPKWYQDADNDLGRKPPIPNFLTVPWSNLNISSSIIIPARLPKNIQTLRPNHNQLYSYKQIIANTFEVDQQPRQASSVKRQACSLVTVLSSASLCDSVLTKPSSPLEELSSPRLPQPLTRICLCGEFSITHLF